MKVLKRAALVGAASLCLPGLALAQVRYETLTLAEAAYLYSGLAMQAMLRASSLRHLPQVIVVCCTMWLVYRRVTSPRPQPFTGIVAYVISCGLILVLFWPEAAPRFLTVRTVIPSGGVTSYIAVQNGMASMDARSSGLVPARLRGGTEVPLALDLILRAVTEMPLTLGNAINGGLERPFERVEPLKEFVEEIEGEPPTYLVSGLEDFAPTCYEPAIKRLRDAADGELTQDDIYPWSAAMRPHLSQIRVNQGGFRSSVMTCEAFYQDLETKTVDYLRSRRTAQGSNKARVVRNNLDIRGLDQARMFVQRELERQVLEVQSPNRVVAAKRALESASSGIGVVTNFDFTAPLKSTGTEMQKYIDRMARFLGIGSFLVYWGPYLVGIAMFVVLAFFPVVLLWSLFPGQHFKPLVNYFLLLIFVCSTPLWWAMVDAAAEVAYAQHPTGGWFDAPAAWGLAYTSYMVVTVLGIILVPVMQATLLFGSWRAIGGIWHG